MPLGVAASLLGRVWGAAATPPVISSLDVAQGDRSGGELVPINGLNFTGTVDVTFDGVSAEFLEVSPTLILAIAPSGTAGAKNVVVITGAGASTGGTGAYTYWDPGILSLSLFNERLSYALGEYDDIAAQPSTWSARASAGSSAGRTLVQNTTASASPLEDVKEPVTDGVSQALVSDGGFVDTDVWTDAAGTLIVGGIPRDAAPTVTAASDPGWLLDAGGGTVFASYFSNDGFGISFYSGGWTDLQAASSPFTAIVGQFKWSAGDGHIRVGSGAFTNSVGLGALTNLGGSPLSLGQNYAATVFSRARFRFVLCAQTELSDANCDRVVTWARYRHAMANGGRPELWYMSTDVVHTTPKRIRVFGKNLGNVVDARFGLSMGTLQGAFGTMPVFNGTEKLELDDTLADYFAAGGYSGWMLINMKRARSRDGALNQNDTLLSTATTTGFYVTVLADRKVYITHDDGAAKTVSRDLPAFGDWALVQWKYDGTNLRARVLYEGGATSWTSLAAGNLDAPGLADTVRLGMDASATYGMFGLIAECGFAAFALSDANMDNVAAYLNARHGLTFGAIAPSAFDPASLALRGWWRTGTYAYGTWTGVASAGSSGTRDMTEATLRPEQTDVVDILPPAKAAGTYTLSLKNATGWGTLVGSIEYYDLFTSRAPALAHRVGDVASRTVVGGEVTILEDTGPGGDINRNWVGPGGGVWAAGTSAPTLFAADPDFGGEDSMGNAPTEERNMTSGAYGASIDPPATVYIWMKAFNSTAYFPINNAGGAINTYSFYGLAGLGTWSVSTDGAALLSISGEEGMHLFSAVFDGANSMAFSDSYFTAVVGDTGAGGETSVGIGSYPAEGGGHWKVAARFVFAGRDDLATRRLTAKWGANYFQLPIAA